MSSRSFSSERPVHPHLVTPGTGGVGGEVGDLRRDTEDGFVTLEADVDSRVASPVRLATAAPLNACTAAGSGVGKTLTQNAAAIENINGMAVVLGDRILVKNQVAGKDNGIYTVTTVGTVAVKQVLTRATDANSSSAFKTGKVVKVLEGTNAGSWELTTVNPITLDTTALTFTTVSATAHHTTHELGGTDVVSVAGLTGLLATAQTPAAHKTTHENGGGPDEISVTGLSGLLADGQTPLAHQSSHLPGGADPLLKSGSANAVGAGDVAVAFGTAYADANYKIALGNIGAADAVIKVGTIAAGGFTLTFGAAGDCHWITIHD